MERRQKQQTMRLYCLEMGLGGCETGMREMYFTTRGVSTSQQSRSGLSKSPIKAAAKQALLRVEMRSTTKMPIGIAERR